MSLAKAQDVIDAAMDYVTKIALPAMFVVVVDVAGNEKALARMDGNGPASLILAPIKARTAAAFRTPTATLAGDADPAVIASFTTAGFSLLGGGHPLRSGEVVIGPVGVGGGTPQQDAQVAAAAAAVLEG